MSATTSVDEVRPGDRGYEALRHVYSARGRPASVLLPRDGQQAAAALTIARSRPGPLSIRSGGRGISSIATNTGGTVVDLRHLDQVEHLGGARVRIGAGARWAQVARHLHPLGLALTSGDSGDVGVGGLATTGGIGLLGRTQGLTIDRIRSAELVTADGRLLTVSPEEHRDLFWALRGAGANIGIATSFTFEADTTPDVALAHLAFEITDPTRFLTHWGATVESAPRSVSAFLYLGAGPRPFAQASVVHAGSDAATARRALDDFAELPGLVHAQAQITPYPSVPLSSGAPHAGQQTAVMHTALVEHLDHDLAGEIARSLESGGLQMMQIRSVGGAINDVDPEATAYAHRHQNFSVSGVADRPGAAFDAAWAPIRARRDGLYLSFESDHRPDDLRAAYPGPTLHRLTEIKRRWDPDDVFSQNFDVIAAGHTSDRRS